jgi:hypothetical protein
MSHILSISCPNCGEKLEIPQNTDRVVCSQCGHGYPLDPAASRQAIQRLELEIITQQKLLDEVISTERYKKSWFYHIALIFSVVFSICSWWAWSSYEVVIWIVFFITGLLIAIVSATAVRQQSREIKDHKLMIEDRLQPYQAALNRKQKEMEFYRIILNSTM